MNLQEVNNIISGFPEYTISGKVTGIKGMLVECEGLASMVKIGSRCDIESERGMISAEVVGFHGDTLLLLPYMNLASVGPGAKIYFKQQENFVYPDESWLGRVINAFAEPLDGKGLIARGKKPYSLKNKPLDSHKRKRLGAKIDLGVKAINCFTPCCYGQRMGIFAGSGVGKSVLISMMTKYSTADVKIIGLIGERGREVQEFLEEYLGEEGLQNAIIVVATGDEPALLRRQAAYLTFSIAEYFRDQGKEVLLLVDSITRFAMAIREIGLAVGEPPTTKAYPPSVFYELPLLLERAGPGTNETGNITGLLSVLVDGEDFNDPIADAVRGILDGHIVLERVIAERGRYPSINVLKSVSRSLPACNNDLENELLRKAMGHLSIYNDMAEMIRLGAYRPGSNKTVDDAIFYSEKIEEFLKQGPKECFTSDQSYSLLENILNTNDSK